METHNLEKSIFNIHSPGQLITNALEVFRYQYDRNSVYRQFCQALGRSPQTVHHIEQIPFLPIEFFRKHTILSTSKPASLIFTSSGTTANQRSRHYVANARIYHHSFVKAFELFFGSPEEYHILALLPGYLEREGSSLIYMVKQLISLSKSPHSGFYLDELPQLQQKILDLHNDPRKVLLLGVSFALLDMAEKYPVQHPRMLVMETGGMKGRKKEMVRQELHGILQQAFGISHICSEYGMTELLSQAYSKGKGVFESPPWMKVFIRDMDDPLSFCRQGKTGGVSVMDLANLFSCSFIATQDIGKITPCGGFEIAGRFDHSDIRGCNLMVS